MWAEENFKHAGQYTSQQWSYSTNGVIFKNANNFNDNKQKVYDWLKDKGHNLSRFNFLGGEPLFQKEFIECLDIFDQYPSPSLTLQIFTNLSVKKDRLVEIISKIEKLIAKRKIGSFQVTASLDNWGPEAEYVRFPLDLKQWEENFLYILSKKYINLVINSTLTPLTIKTYPVLLEKVREWSKIRKIYLYQNSVNDPTNQRIDIFGNIFEEDFQKALALKPSDTEEEQLSKDYLDGLRKQSNSNEPNVKEITSLFHFLNDIDLRRNINWRKTFPWLVTEFEKYNLK
jgi:organic radical activating enzyme